MTTGNSSNYGFVTAGWCGNCGRRRGPDGRCPNCDPWWTSPVFQVGGPIVLLVSLALIVGISVFGRRADSGSRIAAARVNSSIAASYVPSAVPAYRPLAGTPIGSAPVISAPAVAANYAHRPTTDEILLRQQEELRRMTAYVDSVVTADQNARAEQSRANSAYPATFAPSVQGRALEAPTADRM